MESLNQFILRVFLGTVLLLTFVNSEIFELAISHCNDVSGQLEAFEKETHNSSRAPVPCTNTDGENCIGGLTNLVHWLFEEKGDSFDFSMVHPLNKIRLSSGNLIGGESGWISAIEDGWTKYARLIKDHVNPKFTALGMKEFGAGLRQTVNFTKEIGGNSITGIENTCERSYTEGAEKEFCELMTQKYTTVTLQPIRSQSSSGSSTFDNYDIGIIGFVTPDVTRLSLPGELEFSDVAESIKKITEEAQDIKTFIAVGDGNLAISKDIIDKAPKVKLVIYGAGFSNTNINTYPFTYQNSYIATAGRYGSSAGKLHFQIDSQTGNVALKNSQLIVTEVPENLNSNAVATKTKVDEWENLINAQKETLIGNSRADLVGGEMCWNEECTIGNLMTDAVVNCVLNRYDITEPFPNVLHSIWHGGAFFEDTVNGTISEFDVHKWLPYHNNVHLVKVKGSDLRKVFETSATGLEPGQNSRQFLQVSKGFEVFYDTNSGTPKVTTIRIVDDVNGVPQFTDLDNDKEYHLAIPTYLFEGRGEYGFAKTIWTEEKIPPKEGSSLTNVFDDECLEDYIKVMKHISVGLEERIKVIQ